MCEVCLNGTYSNCPVCGNDEEQELKTAEATVSMEIHVNCPYCDNQMDILEKCKANDQDLDEACEILVKCDNKKCQEEFIVTKVNY